MLLCSQANNMVNCVVMILFYIQVALSHITCKAKLNLGHPLLIIRICTIVFRIICENSVKKHLTSLTFSIYNHAHQEDHSVEGFQQDNT